MRFSILVIAFLYASSALGTDGRLPDLSRCGTFELRAEFIADCFKRAEAALKHPKFEQLSNRQRSIATMWKAAYETWGANPTTDRLSVDGERLMDEAIKLDPTNFSAVLLRADSDISKGNLADAESRISIARGAVPQAPLLGLIFARILLKKHDFSGAYREYSALIEKRQMMTHAYLGRAEASVWLKNLPAARSDLRKSLKFAAGEDYMLLEIVRGAQEIGLGGEVLPTLDAALRKKGNASLYTEKGKILFDRKDFQGAYDALTQALRMTPDSVEAFILRGRSAFVLKRTDEALLDLEQAEKFGRKNANIHYWRGLMLKDLKKPTEAVASISRAIELDATVAVYWYNRALLHDDLNKTQAALDDYTKTIALSPRNKFAHNNQGANYEELGRLDEAEAAYNTSIQIDSNYIYPNRNLISIYGKKHEKDPDPILIEKGIQGLEKIFKLAPDDKYNLSARGRFYKRIRQCDKAVDDLKAFHEWKPDAVYALTDLGFCLSTLERHQEVILYLEKAIALSPDHPGNLNNLAWSKVKLGQFQVGLEIVERSLKLRPDDIPTLNTRAHARAGVGDREGAIKDHREVLKRAKPGSISAVDSGNALKEMGETPE